MNTYSSPSRYRNCMSFFSSSACSTRTPALNVRSNTLPFFRLRSLVRTKAPPLPGLTCWNSTTVNRPLSSSSVIPFFRSLVVIAGIAGPVIRSGRGLHAEILGGMSEGAAAVSGDDDGVFDTDATDAGKVHARLNRHHVTDPQEV